MQLIFFTVSFFRFVCCAIYHIAENVKTIKNTTKICATLWYANFSKLKITTEQSIAKPQNPLRNKFCLGLGPGPNFKTSMCICHKLETVTWGVTFLCFWSKSESESESEHTLKFITNSSCSCFCFFALTLCLKLNGVLFFS